MDLKKIVRDVHDFPKPGIIFKDITPLLENSEAFQYTINKLIEEFKDKEIDVIVGIDARGFIFASVLAYAMKKSLALVRKKGKLPYQTISYTYELEYGEDTIELHQDSIPKGSKVLIVDDLLATGGTANAAGHLIEQMGGKVAALAFIVELNFLKGRERLKDFEVFSLLQYGAE